MRRELPGGFELDDDPERVDVEAVHRYFVEESYWAAHRSREMVERIVRGSARVVRLYRGERQVGFARVVSDNEVVAYLADVYVEADVRGAGLGVELVREAVDLGPHRRLRWLLHTMDAQGLYERFGFGPPSDRVMERRARAEGT
jgi:GNAT superfamily N-acetyltransferase